VTRVLVTGAAGFIGRHLIRRLIANGTDVIGLDRVRPLDPPVPWVCADVVSLSRSLKLPQVDCIIHAAAITGVTEANDNPGETFNVNARGTIAMLEVAGRIGAAHFCLLSSSEVYGEGGIERLREDMPLKPLSMYGRAKVAAERAVIASAGDFCRTIIRPFNVYGPGQRADFVIPRFIEDGLRGSPQQIVGDGSQLRTFTYVDDLVTGILLAIARKAAAPAAFNIGALEPIAIVNLAAKIDALTGNTKHPLVVQLEDLQRPADAEIHSRCPDIEKAWRDLGYRPTVALDAGLAEVVESAREKLATQA
jgi:UDP-glucose 4-epimerase